MGVKQKEPLPDDGCQAAAENTLALPAGTLLANRYLVEDVLGIGGFGITYKVFDPLYREVCAVKEYAPGNLACRAPGSLDMQVYNSRNAGYYQHGLTRFVEEAQLLRQLEHERAVVHVKECFSANQTAYFVMEFLDGQNLKTIVRQNGMALNSQDITGMVAEVGTAMGKIHSLFHILHRDITPENIFLLKDGSVRLLDFGSARQQTAYSQQGFSVEFKHGFAPPEQYSRSGKQGTYTDVYGLASTYYYALTGTMVPDAMDRLGGKSYMPLVRLRPEVGQAVSEAVDRALALDYRMRTQDMETFVREICPGYRAAVYEKSQKTGTGMPYLEVVAGNRAGVRWNLPADTKVSIGRSPKVSNIIIDGDPMISKAHCILVYDSKEQIFLLKDVSKNGVFVAGGRLEKDRVYRYQPELEFSLSGQRCTIKAGVSYE